MKTFCELIKMNLKIFFYYRWSFLATAILDPLVLFIQVMLIKTIYAYNGTGDVLGYTITRMIWYFAAVKFFTYIVCSYPDQELSNDVITGALGIKLVKPISLMKWDFGKTAAGKVVSFIYSFLPNLLVFTVIAFPDFFTPLAFIKYIVLNFFAFILFYLMSFLLGIFALRWQSMGAAGALKMILLNLASGAVLPLDFFPGIIRKILNVTPFPYLAHVPIRFFLNMPGTRGWNVFLEVLLIQSLWIIVFYLLYKVCWHFTLKFYTTAGG